MRKVSSKIRPQLRGSKVIPYLREQNVTTIGKRQKSQTVTCISKL